MTAKCSYGDAHVLIYACEGGSNVGKLSNKVAEYLREQRVGEMICSTPPWTDLKGFIHSARSAKENIILDDCSVSCRRKIFERFELRDFNQYILTEMGITKEHNFICKQQDIEKIANVIKKEL